jgi:hypothetical protein
MPPSTAHASLENRDKPADAGLLLKMTYETAKKISPQSLTVPPFYSVAGDEIQVLKQGPGSEPMQVRVKGHVFIEVRFREHITALAQEAFIASSGELILRGKPLLKRGGSLVEGLSDQSIFYICGTQLRVIGEHRLVQETVAPEAGGIRRPSFNVKSSWSRSWKKGPNLLLPALSPDDVPWEMRKNLLLPAPEADDIP